MGYIATIGFNRSKINLDGVKLGRCARNSEGLGNARGGFCLHHPGPDPREQAGSHLSHARAAESQNPNGSLGTLYQRQHGEGMSRQSAEPKLEIDRKNAAGNYYIYWTERGQSREKSTFTRDRHEAELVRAEWLLKRQRTGLAPPPQDVLVTDVLSYLLVTRAHMVVDGDRMKDAAAALLPFWSGRCLSEITEETCGEYLAWRNRATETMRRELSVLRTAVNRYAKAGHVSTVVAVHLPPAEEGRIRWLEPFEAIALLKAARKIKRAAKHLPLFILIGLLTGQRKDAILSLKWEDVDLQRGYIDWNPVGRTRTKKRRPRTAIPKRLVKYLIRHRKDRPHDQYVLSYRGERILDVKGSFAKAVSKAGIANSGDDTVLPHTLRHTCATWLMQKGIDKYEACGFLGMTLQTLERNYGHHHPDYQCRARDAF